MNCPNPACDNGYLWDTSVPCPACDRGKEIQYEQDRRQYKADQARIKGLRARIKEYEAQQGRKEG